MQRLFVSAQSATSLIVIAACAVTILATFSAPAAALIACPLMTDQSVTYTCGGCNPPRLESTETANPTTCCLPTEGPLTNDVALKCGPCPLTAGGLQPQSTVCPCPTYCRADNTTATGDGTSNPTATSTNGTSSQPIEQPAESTTPLTSDQLAACQKVAPKIKALLSRIAERSQSQLTLFSTIAAGAESFYTSSGKTLAAYDSLVNSTNNDQQAAQSLINTLNDEAAAGLDCNGTDPKAAAGTLASSAKDTITALQTYHSAVTDLITGIQSVEGGK